MKSKEEKVQTLLMEILEKEDLTATAIKFPRQQQPSAALPSTPHQPADQRPGAWLMDTTGLQQTAGGHMLPDADMRPNSFPGKQQLPHPNTEVGMSIPQQPTDRQRRKGGNPMAGDPYSNWRKTLENRKKGRQ